MKPIDYKLEPQAKTSPVAFAEPVPETLALADPAAQPIEGLDQIQSKLDEAMKALAFLTSRQTSIIVLEMFSVTLTAILFSVSGREKKGIRM